MRADTFDIPRVGKIPSHNDHRRRTFNNDAGLLGERVVLLEQSDSGAGFQSFYEPERIFGVGFNTPGQLFPLAGAFLSDYDQIESPRFSVSESL